MIVKYFLRENFTYWFYALFLLIMAAEIYIYMKVTYVDPETKEMIVMLVFSLITIYTLIMVVIQLISCLIFWIRFRKLTSVQIEQLNEAARNSKKTGRILQSEEVLIYYGQFIKNIILKDGISELKKYKDSSLMHVKGGSISIDTNIILVKRKSGRDISLNCPIKVLEGYKGELPWSCIITTLWLGMSLFIMYGYPHIMNLFINEDDIVDRILFYAGYEWVFWLIASVLSVFLWFYPRYLKNKYIKDKEYLSNKIRMTTLWFYALVVMFAGLIFGEKYDNSNLAREDLKLYRNGIYEEKIGEVYDISEIDSNSTGISYDAGTKYMFIYMDGEKIPYKVVYCKMDERGTIIDDFVYVGENDDFQCEQKIRIVYLKNTKIIQRYDRMK